MTRLADDYAAFARDEAVLFAISYAAEFGKSLGYSAIAKQCNLHHTQVYRSVQRMIKLGHLRRVHGKLEAT